MTVGWWSKCLIEDITGNGQDSTVKKTLFYNFFQKFEDKTGYLNSGILL